jgi:hypothetical protein
MKRRPNPRKRLRLNQALRLALWALGFIVVSLAGIYLGMNYKH